MVPGLPVLSSIDWRAAALSAMAMLAMVRLRLGILPTLVACGVAEVVLSVLGLGSRPSVLAAAPLRILTLSTHRFSGGFVPRLRTRPGRNQLPACTHSVTGNEPANT